MLGSCRDGALAMSLAGLSEQKPASSASMRQFADVCSCSHQQPRTAAEQRCRMRAVTAKVSRVPGTAQRPYLFSTCRPALVAQLRPQLTSWTSQPAPTLDASVGEGARGQKRVCEATSSLGRAPRWLGCALQEAVLLHFVLVADSAPHFLHPVFWVLVFIFPHLGQR